MSPKALWSVAILLAFVLIGAFAFGSLLVNSNDHSVFTSIDTWYAVPPYLDEFRTLESNRFSPVLNEHQRWAQNQLIDRPALPLSAEEIKRLTGKDLPHDGKPYLLRAVVLNDRDSGFSVRITDDSVLVTHGSLGHKPLPMQRSAIVAILPFEPLHTFADCTMAE